MFRVLLQHYMYFSPAFLVPFVLFILFFRYYVGNLNDHCNGNHELCPQARMVHLLVFCYLLISKYTLFFKTFVDNKTALFAPRCISERRERGVFWFDRFLFLWEDFDSCFFLGISCRWSVSFRKREKCCISRVTLS